MSRRSRSSSRGREGAERPGSSWRRRHDPGPDPAVPERQGSAGFNPRGRPRMAWSGGLLGPRGRSPTDLPEAGSREVMGRAGPGLAWWTSRRRGRGGHVPLERPDASRRARAARRTSAARRWSWERPRPPRWGGRRRAPFPGSRGMVGPVPTGPHPSTGYFQTIATTRAQPALAPSSATGRATTVKP